MTNNDELVFYDCNLSYGPDAPGSLFRGCPTVAGLKRELARAGISGGLVVGSAAEPLLANRETAEDLRGEEQLRGVWRLLPSDTGELPPPDQLPSAMKENNIAALTLSPQTDRFLPDLALGYYLEMASERKIPVLLNTSRGLTIEQAADIMRGFPRLTAILDCASEWPSDRLFRPFLDAFGNLYLDMAHCLTAGWLEDMVKRYPARRVLFGSAFPASYLGAHMMTVKQAEIPEADKRLIAGENLKRLLGEARYD